MSRSLRIQYPDAWYHVMNRGRRGDEIICGNKDYVTFIALLKEIVEDYNVGFRNYEVLKIALFLTMGELPEPEFTHRFS